MRKITYLLGVLFLLFLSNSTLNAQCTSCDFTAPSGGTNFNFNGGQTLCVTANTSDLGWNMNGVNNTICVASGVTWTQSFGFNLAGGTVINVYGDVVFDGGVNVNGGTATINIKPGATLTKNDGGFVAGLIINNEGTVNFTSSSAIDFQNNSFVFNNKAGATLNALNTPNFLMNNGTTFNNEGTMHIANLENAEGNLNIKPTGSLVVDRSFNNHGAFIIDAGGQFDLPCNTLPGAAGATICSFRVGDKGAGKEFINNSCIKFNGNVTFDGVGTNNGTIEITSGDLTLNKIVTGTNGAIIVQNGVSTINISGGYNGTNMKICDKNTAGNDFDNKFNNNPGTTTVYTVDCTVSGCGAPAVNCTCPNNLLLYPSFESGTGSLSDWTMATDEPGGNSLFSTDNPFAVCGVNYGYIRATDNSHNPPYLVTVYQNITATAGFKYDLSVYAGTHDPVQDCQIRLQFFDASNTLLSGGQIVQVDTDVDVAPLTLGLYNLSGTAPSGTAFVRVTASTQGIYTGDNTAFKFDNFCLTETAVSCTAPSAIAFTKTAPTCTGSTANNDGKITFTSVTNSDKYFINSGATSTGTYATASVIPATGTDLQTAIPNTGGSYTIRFYNGADACYKDTTITVAAVTCFVQPAIACGDLIDNLQSEQSHLLYNSLVPLESVKTDNSILLGGERDLYFHTLSSTTAPVGNSVYAGIDILDITNGSGEFSILTVQWDGKDNDALNLDADGLGGINFSSLGIDKITAEVAADWPIGTNDSLAITLELWSNSGAASIKTKNYKYPNDSNFYPVSFGFSEMIAAVGSGVNLNSIGAIVLRINMAQNSVSTRSGWDVSMRNIKLECCTTPSAITFTKTAPTCTGATANNDGKITFTSATNSNKYFINSGATSTGTYATASVIPATGTDLQTAIPNTGGSYTIRFYNGADACYKDTTITVAAVTCFVQPNLSCGMLIDSLTAVQSSTTGRVSSLQSSSILIGGERDIEFISNVPLSSTTTGFVVGPYFAGGNVIEVFNQAASLSTMNIQWDGIDNSAALNPIGLGGLDFSTLGIDRISGILQADFPSGTNDSLQITLKIYSNAGAVSRVIKNFKFANSIDSPIEFKFSELTPLVGAGANLSDVGAIELFINMDTNPVSTRYGWDVLLKEVTLNCAVCTTPTAITFTQTAPTCTGSTANNDGKITFTSVTNSDKYFINSGASSTGTYATASAIPATGTILQNNIPNTGGTYTIRFFNGSDACFKDTTITVQANTCTLPCSISAITATPGSCMPSTNKFDLTGQITFINPPTTGVLRVRIPGKAYQDFLPPFLSPLNYTFSGLNSDGLVDTVLVLFSNGACSNSVIYTAPVMCLPSVCTSPSTSGVENYTSSIPLTRTNWNNQPLTIPQFNDMGGTRVLKNVLLTVYQSIRNWGVAESTDASITEINILTSGTNTIKLNGTTLTTNNFTATNYPKTVAAEILVPAQGAWAGDATFTSPPSTLFAMSSAVNADLNNLIDPTLSATWVTNATGNPATDDDMTYFAPVYSDGSKCILYSNATDLMNFTGTGNLNLTASAAGSSNIDGAGNVNSIIKTAADAQIDITYIYCVVGCTTPSSITLSKTAPTCTGATANNDGKITFTSATNSDKYFINSGATSTGTYATASAIPASGTDLQTAIPNTGGSYTIRFFNGSDACFKDTTITVAAVTCSVACTQPTVGTNTASEGTCTGSTPNNDAQIVFTGFTNADKAEKAEAATYTGAAYSGATLTVTSGSLTATGLKHNTQYTFRFWNAADSCYIDVTVTTPSKNCVTPCPSPNCGTLSVRKL